MVRENQRLSIHMVNRRAGKGPRKQKGGEQQIYKCDPSDPTAQQHPKPCDLGSTEEPETKRTYKITWETWRAVSWVEQSGEGKPEAASL